VHQAVQKKRPGKLSKTLLYDDACPCTENLTKVTLLIALTLASSDFHLFGPLKVHLGEQKFQTDDKLKCGVLNRLCSQDKTFYAAGIINLPG
jgi:hypothetical protein